MWLSKIKQFFLNILAIRKFGADFYIFLVFNIVLLLASSLSVGLTRFFILAVLFIANLFIVLSKISTLERVLASLAGAPLEARAVIEALHLPAILYDDNLKILAFNKSAEDFFGVSKDDIIDREITPEFFKAQKFLFLASVMLPSFAEGSISIVRQDSKAQVQHLTLNHPRRILEIVSSHLQNKKGEFSNLKIIRDISSEAQGESLKVELLNTIAHQLRTPLTEIKWFLESLAADKLSPQEQESLAQVKERLAFLVKSVSTILESAKVSSVGIALNLQEGNIIETVKAVFPLFERDLQNRKVKLIFTTPQKLISPFKFDQQKIAMVLFNLIENAIRYNRPGGSIEVNISKLATRPYVEIVVKDTGMGMSEADRAQIFTKFFRSPRAVKEGEVEGTGLGLYVGKKFVEAHGGDIKVESKLDQGSTFTVLLPTDEALIPKT